MPDLSIILVNWNCIAFTEQCIASIQANTQGLIYEVIVVDNNSSDAPCQSLREKFPWIELVLSEQNIGFGRANNLGVQYASAQNILFLNPDTIVKADALSRMLAALKSDSNIGALGCKLLNADLTLQTTCVHAFPTILNQLLALDWLQSRWPNLSLWRKQALYATGPGTLYEVDAVSGAAILVRRQAFEEVGGFNPEYFMYAEEIELCYQIHHAGLKVMHLRDAEIIHFGGQSSQKCEDTFASVAMRDSVFRFFRRTRGNRVAVLYRVGIFGSSICRLALLTCAAPFRWHRRAGQTGNASADRSRRFKKWLAIARWSVKRGNTLPTGAPAMAESSPLQN